LERIVSKILDRIERAAGVAGLPTILAEKLSATDLQSLMLEVYRRRSRQRRPSAILSDYRQNRFVRPAAVSPLDLMEWEQLAFSLLPPDYQPITLSPVCPLGTNAGVARVDQNWAVSTCRNTEVISDSTNVLALECAVRRREMLRLSPKSGEQVHLATSHRLLRAQRYDNPLLLPHFSLLALASAGRAQPGIQFELATIQSHIRFYLRALRAYLGPDRPLRLTISDFRREPRPGQLVAGLVDPMRPTFPGTEMGYDSGRTAGKHYYSAVAFHIFATTAEGVELLLVDGGTVDWTQQYLGNAKERLVASGIGSERLCSEFPRESA
jgi:hypothetical protein